MKIKKKLASLALISLLVTPLLPAIALAQPVDQCNVTHDVGIPGCTLGSCNFQTNPQCGICCVMNAIFTITDWIFYILVAVVALLVIWGGFTIATAGGAPDKVNAGRNFIMFAMLGFAIALLARAIPAVVRSLLGV
jgi:hypothetical protein